MTSGDLDFGLAGKVVAITGAGRGIGRAAAILFARAGAHVMVLERDEACGAEAQATIRAEGLAATFIPTDVADAGIVSGSFARIEKEAGALHVLYHNAAIFRGQQDAALHACPPQVWDDILRVNLTGVFLCSRAGIPLIERSGGGSVILTASTAALKAVPNCDAYTATKGAIVALTRSMAVEYGPKNIRVNCIAPAAVSTPMLRETRTEERRRDAQDLFRAAPLARFGRPEEIGRIALFLASRHATYLNGAVIVADGGITLQ